MPLGNALAHSLSTFRTSAQGPGHRLGYQVSDEQGRVFEYVHFFDAPTKGTPVGHYYSGSSYYAIKNLSSATFGGARGIVQGSGGAAKSYGWIQTKGLGAVNLVVSGTVGADKPLTWKGDGKSAVNPDSAPFQPFGHTLKAKSGSNVVAGKYVIWGRQQEKLVGVTSTLDTFTTAAEFDPGYRFTDYLGRQFTYVKFHDVMNSIKGAPVGSVNSGSTYEVSPDISTCGLANNAQAVNFLGIVQGSGPAANQHGWVQTRGLGRVPAKIVSGGSAAGTNSDSYKWTVDGSLTVTAASATDVPGELARIVVVQTKAKSGTTSGNRRLLAGGYIILGRE